MRFDKGAIRTRTAKGLNHLIFDFMMRRPPVMTWQELYDLTFFSAQPATARDICNILLPRPASAALGRRVETALMSLPMRPVFSSRGYVPWPVMRPRFSGLSKEAGGVIVAIHSLHKQALRHTWTRSKKIAPILWPPWPAAT